MTRIAVIVGSTRPGRRGTAVARWVEETAARHAAVKTGEATVEIVDIAEYGLPLLDEPLAAISGQYSHAHTRRWAEKIASYDAFVFVTPEYNHSFPASLKNAIDYLYAEWQHKAAGFVSYAINGGSRAVEQLRQVAGELKLADVHRQVELSMFTDFRFTDPADPADPGVCEPAEHHEPALHEMLDELIAWSAALAPLRVAA